MEEDKQFLDIVQRHGSMPNSKRKGAIKTFCEQVQQEFNALALEYGYKMHSTWKATLNRYNRLRKRMQ